MEELIKIIKEYDWTKEYIKEYEFPNYDFLDNTNRHSIYKCCEHCMNNPMNNKFASGVCNCVSPYMEMITY